MEISWVGKLFLLGVAAGMGSKAIDCYVGNPTDNEDPTNDSEDEDDKILNEYLEDSCCD